MTDIPVLTMLGQAESDSLLDMVQKGGVVGYIIIAMSVLAVILIFLHVMQIRRKGLLPPEQLDAIDDYLSRGEVNDALTYCLDPDNDSYFTRILSAGLTRFQKSAFGAFEIKSAIEEAGEEQTSRLYRSTDALGVIGTIAPLLGLLGTVVGMVGAFSTLSQSAATRPELLAEDISLALVTTLMGLILAIPCIAFFTFFRNRIDAFASEAAREIERIILHLESGATTTPPGHAGPGGPASQRTTAQRQPAAAQAGNTPAPATQTPQS